MDIEYNSRGYNEYTESLFIPLPVEEYSKEGINGILDDRIDLSREQKKSLSNFRDQVRYKDYKGLIRTLQVLEPVISTPKRYCIPEKYQNRYEMIKENILLLKNIIISDIKYSISNDKGLDKSVVLMSTILSERYTSDVQLSIVTWMSNSVLNTYSKDIQKINTLEGTEKGLKLLLDIKDQIGIKTAHLPIWWNISKVILRDLTIVLKNTLSHIVNNGSFKENEYLDSLIKCMEFEKTYLSRTRNRTPQMHKNMPVLRVSEETAEHLKLLEDISTEQPLLAEEYNENSLTVAFIPHIHIYIHSLLKEIETKRLFFSGHTIDKGTYEIYKILTSTLAKLAYFKFPSVGYSFLAMVDEMVADVINRSIFNDGENNYLSGIETVYYIRDTTKQMVYRLEQVFGISHIDSEHTIVALSDLVHKIYTSYGISVQRRLQYFSRPQKEEQALQKYLIDMLALLKEEINKFTQLIFSPKTEVIKEWLDILGESLFTQFTELSLSPERAKSLLCFMSSLEVPLKAYILNKLEYTVPVSVFDRTKLFLKIFISYPEAPKEFINNYHRISNGLFAFHQVLTKVPKKYHKELISEFNASGTTSTQVTTETSILRNTP
ncbi:hypothetical protein NEOKW01_0927 [Nematocida sp. AWRm80]|nr:hypothetical protein NEOKW01_0927 [Nematocida sp. AWRm80]